MILISLIYTHFVDFEYFPTVIMPPFRRPHLSHRLVLVASGGVAFRGPPDLCCRRKTSYTACRNPSQQAPSLGVPHTLTPCFHMMTSSLLPTAPSAPQAPSFDKRWGLSWTSWKRGWRCERGRDKMSKCIKSKYNRERNNSLLQMFVEPSLLRLLCMSPTTPSCPPLLNNPGHCTCL